MFKDVFVARYLARPTRRLASAITVAALTAGLLTMGGPAGATTAAPAPTAAPAAPAPAAVTPKAIATARAGSSACPISKKLVPSCGVLLGIAANEARSQTWLQSIVANERAVGRTADVLHNYHQWNTAFPTADETARARAGQVLMLTWMGQRQNGSQASWAGIAAGTEDAVIHAEAHRIAALKVPVYLTFQHEAEALIGRSGTAAQYVAAWRRIHDLFVRDGATNAVWTAVFMGVTSDRYVAAVKALYPGDAYVDYIGWDPYNRAACYGNPWQSYAATIKPFYQWLLANGHGNKPFLLAEFGTVEDRHNPSAKANWFADAAVSLADGEFPNLKVVSYFDHPAPPATCDWRINTSPASSTAYRAFGQALLSRSTIAVTRPSAPVSVTAVAGTGTASLRWAAPSNTGHGLITGYQVSAGPGGPSVIVPGPLPVTSATISGLAAGRAYTFTVTAANSAGVGTASRPIAAVVPTKPRVSISSATRGWQVNRLATWVGGQLSLTDSATRYSMGTAFWPTTVRASAMTVSFDSTIGGGTGGDGLAVVFADAAAGARSTSVGASGSGLGCSGIPGFAVALDTYQSGTGPSNNFVGLATRHDPANNKNLIWQATSASAPALRATNHVSVIVAGGVVSVLVNGTQVLRTTGALPGSTLIGFSAGNGSHTDHHMVSNVVITSN